MNHFTPQMQKNDTNADPCGEISKSTTETGKAALTVWSIKQHAVWHFPAESEGMCLMKEITSSLFNVFCDN